MMKDINQAQDSAEKIFGSISDRLLMVSAGLDTLKAVEIAGEEGGLNGEILTSSLWFVQTALREQVDGLAEDAEKLTGIAKGEGNT